MVLHWEKFKRATVCIEEKQGGLLEEETAKLTAPGILTSNFHTHLDQKAWKEERHVCR